MFWLKPLSLSCHLLVLPIPTIHVIEHLRLPINKRAHINTSQTNCLQQLDLYNQWAQQWPTIAQTPLSGSLWTLTP